MLTIKSGPGLSSQVSADKYPTYGDILADDNLAAILEFGENTECVVNGVAVNSASTTTDGETIVLQPKACQKQVA